MVVRFVQMDKYVVQSVCKRLVSDPILRALTETFAQMDGCPLLMALLEAGRRKGETIREEMSGQRIGICDCVTYFRRHDGFCRAWPTMGSPAGIIVGGGSY